jgi:hypothetical protein
MGIAAALVFCSKYNSSMWIEINMVRGVKSSEKRLSTIL